MGLMQVAPAAGIDTAAEFKVTYDRDRLLKDPVYNVQMGAAEFVQSPHRLQWLVHSYVRRLQRRPRPREAVDRGLWRSARSTCRSGGLGGADPVAETRNYVAAHHGKPAGLPRTLGGGSKLVIEADVKRGGSHR